MVILREATIKYSDNDPDKLKLHSNKRICVSCNICGRIRWIPYQYYRDLCISCAGKSRSPMSKETKKIFSIVKMGKNNSNYGKFGKEASNWKGGFDRR